MQKYYDIARKIVMLDEAGLANNLALLDQCLTHLEQKLEEHQPEKGELLENIEGSTIGRCGSILANYLSSKSRSNSRFIEFEARAVKVWVGSVFAVNAHYQHVVGPAMVASAKLAEKEGKLDKCLKLCQAIVGDFIKCLNDAEGFECKPDPEDEFHDSISSLEYAIDKLIQHNNPSNVVDIKQCKERIKKVWEKPGYLDV